MKTRDLDKLLESLGHGLNLAGYKKSQATARKWPLYFSLCSIDWGKSYKNYASKHKGKRQNIIKNLLFNIKKKRMLSYPVARETKP